MGNKNVVPGIMSVYCHAYLQQVLLFCARLMIDLKICLSEKLFLISILARENWTIDINLPENQYSRLSSIFNSCRVISHG